MKKKKIGHQRRARTLDVSRKIGHSLTRARAVENMCLGSNSVTLEHALFLTRVLSRRSNRA